MRSIKALLFSVTVLLWVSAWATPSYPAPITENAVQWRKWLDEVDPIITKAERSVFLSLKTEEDRKRFQEMFWKARNPLPQSSRNEFRMEYYRRRAYADRKLGGTNSDRGRIYILLGEPTARHNFSGDETLFDCELWNYDGLERGPLPSFIQLIFYKPRNTGDYKLFVPGIHTALDLISPSNTMSSTSQYKAYRLILMGYPELAQATLSMIPGEGNPSSSSSPNSSGTTLAQIYGLPEKEVSKTYINNFTSLKGVVDVSYSTSQIGGKGSVALSDDRGYKFLNYALMPDEIHTTKTADDLNFASIRLNLRIEDLSGRTIFQQERSLELKMDDAQKKSMLEDEKPVFKDFAPIINGEFNVIATFNNRTTNEFFVFKQKISATDKTIPVLVGYDVQALSSGNFLPFSAGRQKVFLDPRSIYGPNDSLNGIVCSERKPTIQLANIDNEKNTVDVENVTAQGDSYIFRLPVKALKRGNYFLNIKVDNEEAYSKLISVITFDVKKPKDFEWSDAPGSGANYTFLLAQQYLNKGEVETAIRYLRELPPELWNSASLPIIGRAYYMKQDYKKVIELLESEKVEKDYPVLTLLAHSCLYLGRWQASADYFEKLRKYGDTAEINGNLAKIYEALGDKEKAAACLERAETLKNKSNGGETHE